MKVCNLTLMTFSYLGSIYFKYMMINSKAFITMRHLERQGQLFYWVLTYDYNIE